eukprot:9990271-Alexandrium_andersonii.AAC.1
MCIRDSNNPRSTDPVGGHLPLDPVEHGHVMSLSSVPGFARLLTHPTHTIPGNSMLHMPSELAH